MGLKRTITRDPNCPPTATAITAPSMRRRRISVTRCMAVGLVASIAVVLHHIIAVLAYVLMKPDQYNQVMGIAKASSQIRALPKDSSETLLEELTSFVEIHVETDNPETDKWAPLVSLNFTDCQITAEHLKVIAPLRKLQELKLNGTPVGDADLEPLKAYNFLKILDLSGTDVTRSGIEAIRQSLPETKIIYEPKQK